MARLLTVHEEEVLLVLSAREAAALGRMLDADPPTLPDELSDLHDLFCGYDDEDDA